MLRTAVLILSGNAAASAFLLARNLLVARLIPVADYGIAATFAMVMAVIEMASNLGLHQQIVQAREGDDPRFQAALQGFQLLRGLIGAALLFTVAGPIAQFLEVPQAATAYHWLALVPLLNALQHFDIHRAQRAGRYGPLLLTGTVPAFVTLVMVWPLAAILGDWRVMLIAMIAQAVLAVLTSHLSAERPWRLAFDRAVMAQSLRFGAPLLINAALLYLVFQGDKIIVAKLSGIEALAIYAMGVTLTLTPTLIAAKSTQNLFLPRLSTLNSDGHASAHRAAARATIEAALINGTGLVLAVFVLGRPVVAALLGTKFAALIPLLVPFAILHALRVFKSGPAVVALSLGATGNALWGNLPRVAALPIAWWLLSSTGSLVAVIWLGAIAELLGFALSMARLSRVMTLPPVLPALAATAVALVCVTALTLLAPAAGPLALRDVIVALGLIVLQLAAMRGLRQHFTARPAKEA